jgi:L-arabinose isomerase
MNNENNTVTIGLVALCAEWFRQVDHNSESGDLSGMLQQDYERISQFLEECFGSVVAPGPISTVAEARNAIRVFNIANIDAVVLVHILWSEDQPLIEIMNKLDRHPVILWDYHPQEVFPEHLSITDLFRRSGTVGLLQGSSPMARLGFSFQMVSGRPGDSKLTEELLEYKTALSVCREFNGLRIGRIAGNCEIMTGTIANVESVHKYLGVELLDISLDEYAAACFEVSDKEIVDYASDIIKRYEVREVSTKSLQTSARCALGLERLVEQQRFGAVGIQDLAPGLHRILGTRPCLPPWKCISNGVVFVAEADMHCLLALFAASKASCRPCMYTEVFTYDRDENFLLMGHAGIHDPELAAEDRMIIVPDYEYCRVDEVEGAWLEFIMSAGEVTCLGLHDTGSGYRMIVFEGESLGSPSRLQGFPHALVRPNIPVNDLLRDLVKLGVTQHFAIAQSRISGVLSKWCSIMGVEYIQIG